MSTYTIEPHAAEAGPATPHTLAEFAPYLREMRGAHPAGLIPVGYWYPTPEHLEYLRRSLESALNPTPGVISDPPPQVLVPRFRERLEIAQALPRPRANTSTLSYRDTDQLVSYLTSRQHYRVGWCGVSTCRLCGGFNGSEDCEDAIFVWPAGLAHYVLGHDVGLPEEFVSHALRGGVEPRVERRSGFAFCIANDTISNRVSNLIGRVVDTCILPDSGAVQARVAEAYVKVKPLWDIFAVGVNVVATNGRVSEVSETGIVVRVAEGQDDRPEPDPEGFPDDWPPTPKTGL